jgi:hypothetical protein
MKPLVRYIVFALLVLFDPACDAFSVATVTPREVMSSTTTSLSVELWWRTPYFDYLSSGTPNGKNDSECSDLALGITNDQSQPVAWVAFRTADAFFDSCRTIYFIKEAENEHMRLQPNQLVHFVASLQDQEQRFYWNGRRIATTYESWNNTQSDWGQYLFFKIQLLGQSLDINSNGTFMVSNTVQTISTTSPVLYRFTMFETALDDTAVLERIQQGLPSTPAVAVSQTIALYEDAESIPQSHAPDWYLTPTQYSQAAPLQGPRIACLDCDVQHLQREIFPNVTFPVLPTIYAYITQLPAVGQLYLDEKKGTLLSSSPGKATFIPLPPIKDDPWTIRSLVYIPPHNRAAFLTLIRYCVSAAPIWNAAQCDSTATVNLRVEAVNDPPVVIPVPKLTLTEGTTASVQIPLGGTDVDDGDGIATVQIVAPPIFGMLQLVVSSFRQNDFLPHGTPLSHINYTISVFTDPVYVQYVWRRPRDQVIVSTGVLDFFTFRVQDHEGVWSSIQRVDLQVVSALSAESAGQPVLLVSEKEEGVSLHWRGSDATGELRRYGFHVERIPSPDMGWLFHPASNQSINKAGITLATNASMTMEMLFYSTPKVCQRLNTTTTTDIHFRFVAYGSTYNDSDYTFVESVSDAFVQTIVVDCAKDRLSLTVPNINMTVRQFTLADVRDPCAAVPWSNASSPPTDDCPNVLRGIQVAGGSMKDRQVLVTLTTQFGFLTLLRQQWNQTMLDPVLGRPVLAAGAISFAAAVTDATRILSALHYQSYVVGWDRIDVELQELDCSFSSESCPIPLRESIEVEVVAAAKIPARGSLWRGPWNILICLFVYPLVYWAIVWLEMSRFPIGNSDDDDADTVGSAVLEPTERRFREHEDADGMLYYEDTWNGTTRWDLPEGEDCLHRDEADTACR